MRTKPEKSGYRRVNAGGMQCGDSLSKQGASEIPCDHEGRNTTSQIVSYARLCGNQMILPICRNENGGMGGDHHNA